MSDFVKSAVILGDRLLIRPKIDNNRTSTGLFLPLGVKEKEKIQNGFILKTGPGYAVAPPKNDENSWETGLQEIQYIPLEVNEGDLAIYLQSMAHEIEYKGEKYVIVPQSAVLMVIRDD